MRPGAGGGGGIFDAARHPPKSEKCTVLVATVLLDRCRIECVTQTEEMQGNGSGWWRLLRLKQEDRR